MLTPTSFIYSLILIIVMVEGAKWLVPGPPTTAEGCRIEYVYDGDTVSLECGGMLETARVVGLDAPETKSPGCQAEADLGQKATDRLRQLVRTGDIALQGSARDKYGRLLVTIEVAGVDVADTLVREELAMKYNGGSRINWCDRLEG